MFLPLKVVLQNTINVDHYGLEFTQFYVNFAVNATSKTTSTQIIKGIFLYSLYNIYH